MNIYEYYMCKMSESMLCSDVRRSMSDLYAIFEELPVNIIEEIDVNYHMQTYSSLLKEDVCNIIGILIELGEFEKSELRVKYREYGSVERPWAMSTTMSRFSKSSKSRIVHAVVYKFFCLVCLRARVSKFNISTMEKLVNKYIKSKRMFEICMLKVSQFDYYVSTYDDMLAYNMLLSRSVDRHNTIPMDRMLIYIVRNCNIYYILDILFKLEFVKDRLSREIVVEALLRFKRDKLVSIYDLLHGNMHLLKYMGKREICYSLVNVCSCHMYKLLSRVLVFRNTRLERLVDNSILKLMIGVGSELSFYLLSKSVNLRVSYSNSDEIESPFILTRELVLHAVSVCADSFKILSYMHLLRDYFDDREILERLLTRPCSNVRLLINRLCLSCSDAQEKSRRYVLALSLIDVSEIYNVFKDIVRSARTGEDGVSCATWCYSSCLEVLCRRLALLDDVYYACEKYYAHVTLAVYDAAFTRFLDESVASSETRASNATRLMISLTLNNKFRGYLCRKYCELVLSRLSCATEVSLYTSHKRVRRELCMDAAK